MSSLQTAVFYDEDALDQDLIALLQTKEDLLRRAVFGDVSLYWTAETDGRGHRIYKLIRRGMADDCCLAKFTRRDIESFSAAHLNQVLHGDIEKQRERDKQHVLSRIRNFVHRLNKLYRDVESWLPPHTFRVVRDDLHGHTEEYMKRHDVHPVDLPKLSLIKGTQHVAFIPSALWIIGADGRLNVSVNGKKQYTLVDLRTDQAGGSDWHIVVPDVAKGTVPFTRVVFMQEILGALS